MTPSVAPQYDATALPAIDAVRLLFDDLPAPHERELLDVRYRTIAERLLEYHAYTPLSPAAWDSVIHITKQMVQEAHLQPWPLYTALARAAVHAQGAALEALEKLPYPTALRVAIYRSNGPELLVSGRAAWELYGREDMQNMPSGVVVRGISSDIFQALQFLLTCDSVTLPLACFRSLRREPVTCWSMYGEQLTRHLIPHLLLDPQYIQWRKAVEWYGMWSQLLAASQGKTPIIDRDQLYGPLGARIPLTQETLVDVVDTALAHNFFQYPTWQARINDCIAAHPEWLAELPLEILPKLHECLTPDAAVALAHTLPAYALLRQLLPLPDAGADPMTLTAWYGAAAECVVRNGEGVEWVDQVLRHAGLSLCRWHLALHAAGASSDVAGGPLLMLRGTDTREEQLPASDLQKAFGWDQDPSEVSSCGEGGWVLDMAPESFEALVSYVVDAKRDFDPAALVDLFLAADMLSAPALQSAVVMRAERLVAAHPYNEGLRQIVLRLRVLNDQIAHPGPLPWLPEPERTVSYEQEIAAQEALCAVVEESVPAQAEGLRRAMQPRLVERIMGFVASVQEQRRERIEQHWLTDVVKGLSTDERALLVAALERHQSDLGCFAPLRWAVRFCRSQLTSRHVAAFCRELLGMLDIDVDLLAQRGPFGLEYLVRRDRVLLQVSEFLWKAWEWRSKPIDLTTQQLHEALHALQQGKVDKALAIGGSPWVTNSLMETSLFSEASANEWERREEAARKDRFILLVRARADQDLEQTLQLIEQHLPQSDVQERSVAYVVAAQRAALQGNMEAVSRIILRIPFYATWIWCGLDEMARIEEEAGHTDAAAVLRASRVATHPQNDLLLCLEAIRHALPWPRFSYMSLFSRADPKTDARWQEQNEVESMTSCLLNDYVDFGAFARALPYPTLLKELPQ